MQLRTSRGFQQGPLDNAHTLEKNVLQIPGYGTINPGCKAPSSRGWLVHLRGPHFGGAALHTSGAHLDSWHVSKWWGAATRMHLSERCNAASGGG